MKLTRDQPRRPLAQAQTWQGDNQTPPWVELQQLAFKSQETDELKLLHSQTPLLLPLVTQAV